MSQHRGGIITEQMKDLGVSPLSVGNKGRGGWRKWEKKRRGQKFYLGCIACIHNTNEQLLIVLQCRHM